MKDKAGLVLFSGGLDSSCLAAYLKLKMNREVYLLFIARRQRALEWELKAAESISAHLGLEKHLLKANYDISLEKESFDTQNAGTEDQGYIGHPERNLALIALAYGIAAKLNIGEIYLACNKSDGDADTTKEFFEKANATLQVLEHPARIVTPFLDKYKAEIIEWALEEAKLGIDFLRITRTCWEGKQTHCGKCTACFSRTEAFKDAGIEDPTEYLISRKN